MYIGVIMLFLHISEYVKKLLQNAKHMKMQW